MGEGAGDEGVPEVAVPEGLVYVTDREPGIRRLRRGRGFSYVAPDGTTLARGPERARLEGLGVPPAYEGVWMCPLPNGHLQATGLDGRGRKQYRYHPDWATHRSGTKFAQLPAFGRALPAIRARVARDLGAPAGDPRFALAAAVTLIDRLALRVGNEDYARENGSFGALTLQNGHVRLKDGEIALDFRAKGGQRVRRSLRDRRLARVLEKAADLPGAELLTWVDASGAARALSSTALNAYLAEADGDPGVAFTAKTFRTWAGTLAAFLPWAAGEAPGIAAMAAAASRRLHNTPAVARASYVHPAVIALAGSRPDPEAPAAPAVPGLTAPEAALLDVLDGAVG